MDQPSPKQAPGGWTALLLVGAGVALAALGVWGLLTDVVWISQPFYAYGWWGWILVLDGFCVWRRGSSLLTTRRSLLPLLCTSSVTFWVLFEALNLRFRNWYYIGTFELTDYWVLAGAGLFVVAAFATVFVGMFEAFDALGAAKILTRRSQPRPLPGWLPTGLQALGLTMAILAVAFPFYLAPLIWGSFTFLLDPINYRKGRRSLLRDIEAGDGRAVWRLFLAGLISGLVWESLNFAAPQKWIYTVRGLEGLKLFEMPLLGFLGFPALAFDAVTCFTLLSAALCGNVAWEHEDDLAAPGPPASGGPMTRYWLTLPAQAAFWVLVTIGVMGTNIGSIRLRLERMPSVADQSEDLAALDIRWPRQLLRALRDPERRTELQAQLDWSEPRTRQIQDELDLFLFKGIGSYYGRQLQAVGIDRIAGLAPRDPVELHAVLSTYAASRQQPAPSPDWVRVWVLASRDRGILMGR